MATLYADGVPFEIEITGRIPERTTMLAGGVRGLTDPAGFEFEVVGQKPMPISRNTEVDEGGKKKPVLIVRGPASSTDRPRQFGVARYAGGP